MWNWDCFYKQTFLPSVESRRKPTVHQGLSELSSVTLWHPKGTNKTFCSWTNCILPSLNSLFKMPHLSQMEIKWRKYVFFLLLDQIAFNGSNTEWIYSCNLCGTLNTHRPSMYFHLETCHSSPRILDYILSLEFKASKHEIVQYFCDDHNTNISMQ